MRVDKKRVLIVDDEPAITRLLKLNLEQTNEYVVRTENSAEAALESALQFHPDLILLDVVMPGLDGGQLAGRLQAHSALKDVPIVFLTAAATKEEVASHKGLIGGLSFLAKPVDLAEVMDCLKSHLGTSLQLVSQSGLNG
jgi:DNA-binding response OmpR family regulator